MALFGDLESYYRWHSKIYDLTRWTFLFGRNGLMKMVTAGRPPARILEIGCGTGKNLAALAAAFPQAHLTGLDLSAAMIGVAGKRLAAWKSRCDFVQRPYDAPLSPQSFDLVLFSYTLSMINPGWDAAIEHAFADLAPGGTIASVDFHDSPSHFFRAWMRLNHVEMRGHLVPKLEALFPGGQRIIRRAYGGLWSYFLFRGHRPG